MKRRGFLACALALPPFTPSCAPPPCKNRKKSPVTVPLPLIFQEGDGRSYVRDGRLHTPIGDKMQRAIESVLTSNPNLRPDLKRTVAFDLRQADGKPWGSPGPVRLP